MCWLDISEQVGFSNSKKNVQFVCIDLIEGEDEQQVFDTINSLGVRLTTAELLKNYFFDRNNVAEYEEKWVSVFEDSDDASKYWDTEIEAGRIKRSLIDIFFDSYFQLFVLDKKYNVTAEDRIAYSRIDQLSKSYQDFIKKYCHGDKEVIISSMQQYAKCFMECFDPDHCKRSLPSQPSIERINVLVFGLKNSTLIPYVLYLAKEIEDNSI